MKPERHAVSARGARPVQFTQIEFMDALPTISAERARERKQMSRIEYHGEEVSGTKYTGEDAFKTEYPEEDVSGTEYPAEAVSGTEYPEQGF